MTYCYFASSILYFLKGHDLIRFRDPSCVLWSELNFFMLFLLLKKVLMKSHPHPERPNRVRAIAASLAAAG